MSSFKTRLHLVTNPLTRVGFWDWNSPVFYSLRVLPSLLWERKVPRDREKFLWVGLTLELLVFGCSVPSFGTVLGPEFTWYFLTSLSFILLVVILEAGA